MKLLFGNEYEYVRYTLYSKPAVVSSEKCDSVIPYGDTLILTGTCDGFNNV